jgi:hypothetical protein
MKSRLPGFSGELSLRRTESTYRGGVALMAHSGGVVPAVPVSPNQARDLCGGKWIINPNGTTVCAWCDKTEPKKCHYIACDESGCDYVSTKTNLTRLLKIPGSIVELSRY